LLQKQAIGSKINLLDQVRITLRTIHYSPKTEESYISWIKQFIIFNNETHPEKLGKKEIQKFINYLAVERNSLIQNKNLINIKRAKK
jgi:hypothetical protein